LPSKLTEQDHVEKAADTVSQQLKKGYGCFSTLTQILLDITFYYFIIFCVDKAWHLARCMAQVAMQWWLFSFLYWLWQVLSAQTCVFT
jgi:hypothetical protein